MIGGIVIEGQEYTLQGVPQDVFVNGAPSLFRDPAVRLPIVERIDRPKEGGFYTYFKGQKFPRKGVLTPDGLRDVGFVKRATRSDAKLLATLWFLILPILLIPYFRSWFLWKIAEWYAERVEFAIARWYVKPKDSCPAVRTFYQSCAQAFQYDAFTNKERWIVDRFVLGMGSALEWDDTYRYRFQDVVSLLNKSAFKRNPAKELRRLYAILNERELSPGFDGSAKGGMKTRFDHIFKAIPIFFFLFPVFKKKAIMIAEGLDLAMVKMDEGDMYQSAYFPDYKYGGKTPEERGKWRDAIDKEFNKGDQMVMLKKKHARS